MSDAIEPFEIRVDDAELEDLRHRLARTRFAEPVAGDGWEAGHPDRRTSASSSTTGRTATTGVREEARLNAFPQFRTSVDGQSIHFLHVRSPHDGALPLLLVHGWPGSFVEFLDVIPRL